MLLLALASLAFAPQIAREPVFLATDPFGPSALATGEELSVVVHGDDAAPGLRMWTSDGRGLSWSPPIPVDEAPPGTSFPWAQAIVDDVAAWIGWTDDRDGGLDVFVRSYDAATGLLGPEVSPSAGLQGTVDAPADFDVTRVGDERRVHVAMIVRSTAPGGGTSQQVMLASSTDGGATFSPPVPVVAPVSTAGASSFSRVAVEAEGDLVYVAWSFGDPFGEATYLQRSSDGGRTFDFAEATTISYTSHTLLVRMRAVGSTLAFVLWSYEHDFPTNVQVALVSSDAGATLLGTSLVLPPPVAFPFSQNADVAISADGGTVVAAWEEQVFGVHQIHSMRTTDGGATWSSPELLTPDGGRYVALAAAGPGRERVVATWRDAGTGRPFAALSYDGGASFGGPVELGSDPMESFSGAHVAYNDRYQNAIVSWITDATPREAYVGGLRPQYVEPVGFAAGSTSIGASLKGFDDQSALALVLLSSAPGDLVLPFGDGRALGLGLTPIFVSSVDLALAGPLAAALAPDGSGALAPIAVPPLPSGTLHAAALAIDLVTLGFGDVSDVVRLDL